jgi:hypothetical protein
MKALAMPSPTWRAPSACPWYDFEELFQDIVIKEKCFV